MHITFSIASFSQFLFIVLCALVYRFLLFSVIRYIFYTSVLYDVCAHLIFFPVVSFSLSFIAFQCFSLRFLRSLSSLLFSVFHFLTCVLRFLFCVPFFFISVTSEISRSVACSVFSASTFQTVCPYKAIHFLQLSYQNLYCLPLKCVVRFLFALCQFSFRPLLRFLFAVLRFLSASIFHNVMRFLFSVLRFGQSLPRFL